AVTCGGEICDFLPPAPGPAATVKPPRKLFTKGKNPQPVRAAQKPFRRNGRQALPALPPRPECRAARHCSRKVPSDTESRHFARSASPRYSHSEGSPSHPREGRRAAPPP